MRSRAFVVLMVLSTALVTGGWLVSRGLDGATSISGPRLFTEVMAHVQRYYVDSVSTQELYGKAIDGMLDELNDPHSVFLRADRLRAVEREHDRELRRRRHPDRRARWMGHRRVAPPGVPR